MKYDVKVIDTMTDSVALELNLHGFPPPFVRSNDAEKEISLVFKVKGVMDECNVGCNVLLDSFTIVVNNTLVYEHGNNSDLASIPWTVSIVLEKDGV